MESLFEILGKDIEVVGIVDWAIAHHKRTGRPPKVAVNADSWWYANLSRQQVQEIRDKSGVYVNPAELNVLSFTLRMLHLGIQLHFVFDGPNLLHNGGRKRLGYDRPSLLLRESFTKLAIPWHESPGEAEADCTNMENLGLVDAVWSENGDALAYGSRRLIGSYRETKLSTEKRREDKSFKDFQIYDVQEIAKSKPGMDRDGFILNALLTGGENGPIPEFLPHDVLRAARNGLQRSLKAASGSPFEFQKWVDTELKSYLKDVHRDLETIKEFPTWDQLQDYVNPKVSTLETLSSITPALEIWEEEEDKIFKFFQENYQWNIKKWAKWIVPLRVVRSLLATNAGEEDQHDQLRMKCDLTKKPKLAKATFVLAAATSLDISAIRKDTFYVETLVWILRKARRNGFANITAYLTPQQSGQRTGGAVSENAASSSTNRPPPFHIFVGGSSQAPSSRRTRRGTPPSPTPMRPHRPISSQMGARTTKNISRAEPAEGGAAAGKGKGRATDHPPAPPDNPRKRNRPSTPEEEPEDLANKKAKATVIDLTSSSESEAAEAASMTPRSSGEWGPDITSQDLKAAIPIFFDDARRSTIVLDDSDTENEYGSFPSSPDLKPLLI